MKFYKVVSKEQFVLAVGIDGSISLRKADSFECEDCVSDPLYSPIAFDNRAEASECLLQNRARLLSEVQRPGMKLVVEPIGEGEEVE